MDPKKYERTWLANKAIYRTRMAVADRGRLIVVAPGVESFGEDAQIDRLIEKYGYRTTPEVIDMVAKNPDLASNLSAAAHLIHGSSEGRFEIVYCPGSLSRQRVESVGYSYADAAAMLQRYVVQDMSEGWHSTDDGEPYYYIRDPGLGLWMYQGHPHAFTSG
jgi:hypothetical protein